ncbi:MAG: CDGSH iron-sulfur domain-containing protein [Phycisphaerales bacterium]|nr:CDGSH iron-sulfur domain-containing protein [Phycisphaerales bacterium]
MAEPIHGTRPIGVDETPGKKAYCTCGHSQKLPYCDGSHNRMDTGCKPFVCELTEPGKKWICQCHQTGTPPWCDGSHKQLAPTQSPA